MKKGWISKRRAYGTELRLTAVSWEPNTDRYRVTGLGGLNNVAWENGKRENGRLRMGGNVRYYHTEHRPADHVQLQRRSSRRQAAARSATAAASRGRVRRTPTAAPTTPASCLPELPIRRTTATHGATTTFNEEWGMAERRAAFNYVKDSIVVEQTTCAGAAATATAGSFDVNYYGEPQT